MDDARRLFWRALALGLLAVLAACAGQPQRQAPIPHAMGLRASHHDEGVEIAKGLKDRYYETDHDCRGLPAVLCSGILMRATARGPGYFVWNPNPGSAIKNGVSFSWLRADSAFGALVFNYTNGFVILPYFDADDPADGYTQLTVLCIFPYDADTTNRRGGNNDGCDANAFAPGTGPCQAQGIKDMPAWMNKFGTANNRYQEQCGFALTPGTPDADDSFAAQATIRQKVGIFTLQNEVMVGTWAQNDAHLPLEAFFYLKGSADGLSQAKLNQAEFQARATRWAPVVEVTLPTRVDGRAEFYYNDSDQQVP